MFESDVKICMEQLQAHLKSKRGVILNYLATELYVRNNYDGEINHYELTFSENDGRKSYYLGRVGTVEKSKPIELFFANEYVNNKVHYEKTLKNGKKTRRHKKYLQIVRGIVYGAIRQYTDDYIFAYAKKTFFDNDEQKVFLKEAFEKIDYLEFSKRFFQTPEYFDFSKRELGYLIDIGEKYSKDYINLLSMNAVGPNQGNVVIFERIL